MRKKNKEEFEGEVRNWVRVGERDKKKNRWVREKEEGETTPRDKNWARVEKIKIVNDVRVEKHLRARWVWERARERKKERKVGEKLEKGVGERAEMEREEI